MTTALDLTKVLQNIAYTLEATEIKFFVQKLLEKSPSDVKEQEVELMLSMGRRTTETDEALKEN